MNGIVSFRLCKLSDEELLKKVDEGTDNIFKTGVIPSCHIPARPDSDYDLLVGELLLRFKERIKPSPSAPVVAEQVLGLAEVDNKINVEAAMNGWRNAIAIDDIKITKL